MTERFSEKDLERAAKELIGKDNDPNVLRRHFCNVCAKAYRRIGNCKKHILNEHMNDVVKRAEDIERELDKKMKEWEKESALKEADEYFDYLLSSINSLKQDVERYKKGFEKARDREEFSSGYTPDKRNMVSEIDWCIHHLASNFYTYPEKGARAMVKLTKAFDFDV